MPVTPPTSIDAERLSQLITAGDVQQVSAALRDNPALLAAQTNDGDTALHIACWQKQLAIVGLLLSYRPNVNARGCYGRTPLHYAVHEGTPNSAAIVASLLDAGADATQRDDNGFSVEDWAKTEMSDGLGAVLDVLRRPRG